MSSAASSTKSSTPLPETATETIKYLRRKGRLKQWAGILGLQALEDHAARQAKNIEAEDAAVRRAAWGGDGASTGDDEMRQTFLGDVAITNATPPTTHPQESGVGTLAKIAIGAAAAASGFGIPISLALPTIVDLLKPAPVVAPAAPASDRSMVEYDLIPGRPE